VALKGGHVNRNPSPSKRGLLTTVQPDRNPHNSKLLHDEAVGKFPSVLSHPGNSIALCKPNAIRGNALSMTYDGIELPPGKNSWEIWLFTVIRVYLNVSAKLRVPSAAKKLIEFANLKAAGESVSSVGRFIP
jgi:hypothetical protein